MLNKNVGRDGVCKTFTYDNYAEAAALDDPSKRIKVELSYCDTTVGSVCNREIFTKVTQSSPYMIWRDIYSQGNLFEVESKKEPGLPGGWTRGQGSHLENVNGINIREQRYTTGCFDWDAVVDGHDHIRKLAEIEIPGLKPKPYDPQASLDCNPAKPVKDGEFAAPEQNDISQQETVERLNSAALAAFALVAASVVGYGMYSFYKRCTA